MPFFVHAGMHKTGSTSIQRTLARQPEPNFTYVDWPVANHSTLFELLTQTASSPLRLLRPLGITPANLARRRRPARNRLREQLAALRSPGVFSAETIFSADVVRLRRFAAVLSDLPITVQVLMYVRPPVSFAHSAFQQRLKGSPNWRLDPDRLIPDYQRAIAALDEVFGRDQVSLRAYHPWKFPQGDVVQGFAQALGLHLSNRSVEVANRGLGAEAVALLYLYRHQMQQQGQPDRTALPALVAALGQFGRQPLRLSPGLLEPILASRQEMLDWLDRRLGRRLQDRHPDSGVEIGCEADLLRLAQDQSDALRDLLEQDYRLPAGGRSMSTFDLLQSLATQAAESGRGQRAGGRGAQRVGTGVSPR